MENVGHPGGEHPAGIPRLPSAALCDDPAGSLFLTSLTVPEKPGLHRFPWGFPKL